MKNSTKDSERILIPTGCIMLDLALSDNIYQGYVLGSLVNIVGDSSSGKTFLLLSLLATLSYDKRFKDYLLIYDEPEASLMINIPKLFGKKADERITRLSSDTIEEFYERIKNFCEKKVKFIYGLDSLDALSCKAEKKKIEGYHLEKPRLMSMILRNIVRDLRDQNSLVVIISQTRERIGIRFGERKTRSGGKALRFYSTHEIWLAIKEHLEEKKKDIGVKVRARVKKNKVLGKLRDIEFDILYDYGIDDIGSIVDFLVSQEIWRREKKKILASKDGFIDSSKEDLVSFIEEKSLEKKLFKFVDSKWKELENFRKKRKPKFQ